MPKTYITLPFKLTHIILHLFANIHIVDEESLCVNKNICYYYFCIYPIFYYYFSCRTKAYITLIYIVFVAHSKLIKSKHLLEKKKNKFTFKMYKGYY